MIKNNFYILSGAMGGGKSTVLARLSACGVQCIPDLIAYARLFQLDETAYVNAANAFRYHPTVFYFSAWEAIYTTDAERKMSFAAAEAFGASVRSIYETFGYQILEVPHFSLAERVSFLLNKISTQ